MFVVVFVKWMYRFTALLFGIFKYSLYICALIINNSNKV